MLHSVVCHKVLIDKTCRLFSGLESNELIVNSFHHKAVMDLGAGLQIVAKATDGVIETIEGINSPVFAVQWHQEDELNDPNQKKIFENFVSICREFK